MNIGKENEYVEFKESLTELEAGVKSISAMLNRGNDAIVYFGVKNNGDIKGLLVGDGTHNKIKDKIKVKIKPSILPEIKFISTENNKDYIEVKASGHDIPYSFDGRYYIRNGASDEQIDRDFLIKIVQSQIDDRIKETRSPEQNLTFNYLKNSMINQGIHITSDKSLHDSYSFKNKNDEYNITAFLLSDQNTYSLRAIRFAGIDKAHMLDKKEFNNQSILKSIDELINYIELYNTKKVDLSHAVRKEIDLFDSDCLREAIVNSVVHNDWNFGFAPTVFIYEDRLEISSYGSLPYKLSKESFFAGKSMPMNRGLFTICLVLKIVEQSGHGVPIIVEKYGKEAYDFSSDSIVVTFRFPFKFRGVVNSHESQLTPKKSQRNPEETPKKNPKETPKKNPKETPKKNPKETPKKPQRKTPKKNPKEKPQRKQIETDIIRLIENNPSITINEITEKLNSTIDSVRHYINKLKNQNVIKHEGSTKAGKWVVIKKFFI